MDKIFNVEIDGQITLPDGSTLGPLEETTVNVVQTSEGGGGADVVIKATYDDWGRNPVATLLTGSFSSLAEKLTSFSPVNVQLVCETRDEDMGESSCLNVPCRVIARGDFRDITNISFISIEPWMKDIGVCVPITSITLNSDNTVQIWIT